MKPNKADCTKYGFDCGYTDAIWPYIPNDDITVPKQKSENCARTNECPNFRAFCRGTEGLAIAETMDTQKSKRNTDNTAEKAQQKVTGRCLGGDIESAKAYVAENDAIKKAAILDRLISGSGGNCALCIKSMGKAGSTLEDCLGDYHIYIRGHGFGVDPEELPTVLFKNLDTKAMPSGLELAVETKDITRLSSRLLKVKVPQAAGTTYNVRFDIIIQRGETLPRGRGRRRGQLTPKDTLEAKSESFIFKYGFTYLCECDALYPVVTPCKCTGTTTPQPKCGQLGQP